MIQVYRSPILEALKHLRRELRKSNRNSYVEYLTVRAADLRALLDAYPRCGECDACQEFILTPDQAPPCQRYRNMSLAKMKAESVK